MCANPVCCVPSALHGIHMDAPARGRGLYNPRDSVHELSAFMCVFKIGMARFKMNSKMHANNLKF